MTRIPLLLAVLIAAPAAGAQDAAPEPAPPAGAPALATVELADTPLMVEGIGLTMLIPADATSNTLRIGDQPNTSIDDPRGRWRISITAPRTADDELTLQGVADSIIQDIVRSGGTFKGTFTKDGVIDGGFEDSPIKLLDRIPNLSINDMAAERFYLSIPGEQAQPDMIRGFTVFKIAPDRYCIFELQTMEPEFAGARGVFETIIGTASFADPGKLVQGRALAVKAGVALFENLTADDYDAAIEAINGKSGERWERLFAPAPGGADTDANEYGYRKIRAWRGQRGEVDPNKNPRNFAGLDLEEGYLIEIRSRVLQSGWVIDSGGTYFMRDDRDAEAWSLKMSVRDPNNLKNSVQNFNEIGVRDRKSMQVTTLEEGQAKKTFKPIFNTDGYISQVERYMLAPLLMQRKAANDYAFYYWNSAGDPPAVTLLRASLEAPEGATDVWTVETRATARQDPVLTFMREDATLIKQFLPKNPRLGELMWVPLEAETLARLWKSKGLPMGDR